MMKRTKIICTLGPAVDSESALKNLVLAGMDVARCNFSHGSHAEHKARMDRLKKVRRELDAPCALMLDTKGPSIRTGKLEGNEPVLLRAGDNFFLTEDNIAGTSRRVHQTFKGLYKYVEPGTIILIDDGLIELAVDRILGSDIQCTVQNSGMLGECKQLNLPGTNVPLPVMTKQDKEDLLFGIQQGVDFVAASFVSCGEDVRAIRAFLAENGGESIRIVAKIENAHAVDHIEEIIGVSDAVMVARGDLGVEVPSNQVPHLQKKIIKACNRAYRPVITATQMLDSMIRNPRPTRAEVADVANAIYDGTSAIMLSGETAAGKYPVEAVQTMDAIARKTESNIDRVCPTKTPKRTRLSITAATAHAACTTAEDIGADAILTVSQRGITAQMVSRFRPAATVVALLLDPQVQRQMALYWGLVPITMPRASSTDQLVDLAIQSAQESGLVKHGDLVVVTAGVPVGISGTTNMIRIAQVGGSLVNAIGVGSQIASGPLCVCRTLEDIPEKFHPGDVLVVPYTNNEVLPWLRQAAAIVSEEASADCHTATVGLLLNKPVIVAASDATRRLKDGTFVSVDCARGIVQVIPQ